MTAGIKIINISDLQNKDDNVNLFISSNMIAYNIKTGLGRSQIAIKSNSKIFLPAKNPRAIFSPKRNRAVWGFFKGITRQAVKGFFLEIIFFGLNYNFKRKRARAGSYRNRHRFLRMELHFAKKIKMKMPEALYFKVFKRRLIVFSFLRQKLISLYRFLQGFRKANPYTGKGIRVRRRSIKYKIGKKRIR